MATGKLLQRCSYDEIKKKKLYAYITRSASQTIDEKQKKKKKLVFIRLRRIFLLRTLPSARRFFCDALTTCPRETRSRA